MLGRLERGWVVASETAALDIVGASLIREVEPGELIAIDEDGLRSQRFAETDRKGCVFEYVYLARPDATIAGRSVHEARVEMEHLPLGDLDHQLYLAVSMQLSCPPGNEERVAEALFDVSRSPGEMLERHITRFLVESSRGEGVESFVHTSSAPLRAQSSSTDRLTATGTAPDATGSHQKSYGLQPKRRPKRGDQHRNETAPYTATGC